MPHMVNGQCVFPEEEKYQLKDEAGEREVGCNLQESLRRAKTSPIFQVNWQGGGGSHMRKKK